MRHWRARLRHQGRGQPLSLPVRILFRRASPSRRFAPPCASVARPGTTMRDQLLARSRSSVLARCGLPMAPTGGKVCARPSDMERPATRWLVVGYYVRSCGWMAAALEAADGHFAVEKANASAILRMEASREAPAALRQGRVRPAEHSRQQHDDAAGHVRRREGRTRWARGTALTWLHDTWLRIPGHEVPAEWQEGRRAESPGRRSGHQPTLAPHHHCHPRGIYRIKL